MTVKELKYLLAKCPDTWEVIMSSDAEGNSYSPLSNVDSAAYVPDSTYSGDLVDEEYRPVHNSVVFWPTN